MKNFGTVRWEGGAVAVDPLVMARLGLRQGQWISGETFTAIVTGHLRLIEDEIAQRAAPS